MNKFTINYIILGVLIFIFSISIITIKLNYSEKTRKQEPNYNRIIIPIVALFTFFAGCYISSILVADSELPNLPEFSSFQKKLKLPQFSGIYYMIIIAVILTILNLTVLSKKNIEKYIKGKKFTVIGLFMALGVSAIVFGFLDNFGMKLGTDALDDSFLQLFLSPFSVHNDFNEPHIRDSIKSNLKIINTWVNNDWRKVINQCLRPDHIEEFGKNPKLKDLIETIEEFDCNELIVPDDIRTQNKIRPYIKNIRDKFDSIDGTKSMLGNTFSDFMGAILGAGIINLFTYSTSYDGINTGDDDIDNSFFVKHLNAYAPIMEAIFIALGCLVPIFLSLAMERRSPNINNKRSWYVVGAFGLIIIIMMAISSSGIKNMTTKDKRKSIKKTIKDMKDRLDINSINNSDESILEEQLDKLVKNI